MNEKKNQQFEASFSTLILSLGSAAMMALGLAPNPATGIIEKNLPIARFNIDLLEILKSKTHGNLNSEEQKFLDSLISDLKIKYVEAGTRST